MSYSAVKDALLDLVFVMIVYLANVGELLNQTGSIETWEKC